ncbi:MAG TPA: hypothetical protein VJ962_02335 [Clostridia bacterium]|nr:hypothetical protein [Clostridia bacterium]
MEIISVRKGFTADHSSTSYEFLAIDKPLTQKDIDEVSSLSSRATPDDRAVKFFYNGDFNDLPGGWWPLMEKHYDILYSESYDWWLFAVAFSESDPVKQKEISRYAFYGLEDLGVNINIVDDRIIVSFSCILDYGEAHEILDSNNSYGYKNKKNNLKDYLKYDPLFQLLADIREQLLKEDYRVFDVFWHEYGQLLYSQEEIKELELPYTNEFDHDSLPNNLQYLARLLRRI